MFYDEEDYQPETRKINLGKLRVTLREDPHEIGVMHMDISGPESLVKPENTFLDRDATAAENLVAIVKQALHEANMMVIEPEEGNKTDGKRLVSATANDYDNINHSSRAIIRAEPEPGLAGDYGTDTEFSTHVMIQRASEALERVANYLKGATTAKAIEDRIANLVENIEVYEQSLDDALQTAPLAPEQAHTEKTSTNNASLRDAIIDTVKTKTKSLSIDDTQRQNVAEIIADGIVGTTSTTPWPQIQDSALHGTDSDPLLGKVEQALKDQCKTSDTVSNIIAGIICDAVYAVQAAHSGEVPAYKKTPAR